MVTKIDAQREAAESAIRAAQKCAAAGNAANARHFWNLAAAHLGVAARMVPHKHGVPLDSGIRSAIAQRFRFVTDHLMADARVAS